jgi:hypothetical protein
MKKSKLNSRLEIRVDSSLLKDLEKYCAEHEAKQSEVLREAVSLFFEVAPLKYLLLEQTYQDPHFREAFKDFLKKCPMQLHVFFEKFLGPEEERKSWKFLINSKNALDSFVTTQGRKAFLKRCEEEHA